ncbi:MAG: tRNA (cytosine(32)/uridine(32)-2'-O)-methyltransferase TrmJ [Gammaproteobacteria bacterium]|nr:MAG: tRNA (cytosine(32)/uridine(32)-2'-O)-methyltransferase TrmJ [Gammaproteobacteria bacterium]
MNRAENFNIYSDFPWANIRIVLVETSHPGNIGAVARAMKNMQLESLYLVSPQQPPDRHSVARSSGATDVLNKAVICNTLDEAISDCRLVIAASARVRSIPWPAVDVAEAADKLVENCQQAPVAMVFGREDRGLNNEELDHCHIMTRLPANPDFSSLNIAAAVQVFSYEIRKSFLAMREQQHLAANTLPDDSNDVAELDRPASSKNLMNLFKHFEDTLVQVHFMPEHRTRSLMRKLMRFFYKSQITEEEVSIFRGILTELQRLSTINCELKK